MPDAITRAQRTERFDLRAIYETSQLLSSSLDLEFVLSNLLLTAMSKLLVTRGAALLHDPLEDAYRAAAVKGLPGLKKGDLVQTADLPHDRMLHGDEVPEALAALRVRLVLPVAFGHRKIGLIGLGKKATGQPYEEQELEFIQSLVNMSSSAVHNSLIVEELRQANRDLDGKIQQLNTLFDLSQEFNATVDRERLVKLFSFALMGQMLVGKHLFMMRRTGGGNDEAEHTLEIVSIKGIQEKVIEPDLVDRLCALEDLVLLEQEAEDAEDWEAFRQCGLVLALPLRQQGETRGLLCLGPKMTGQGYQPDEVEFLYSLGNLALVSIQNAYLFEEQVEKERLEKEMRLAREIQEGLLPSRIPTVPGAEVAALALPSREVGGDYLDAVLLEGNRLLLAIADVTGKGVPAALLMANLQACLHVMVPMDLTLEEATSHMNRVICQNTGYDKFITAFTGIYHAETGQFEYVNAGHEPPMLVRNNGDIELLEAGGLLLGVMRNMPYERGCVMLEPGDTVVMFTDGVTEAMGAEEEEYTPERLEACLKTHHRQSAQALLDSIQQDVIVFTGEVPVLSDDRTMVVLKVTG
ncbi:MAG: SpoIIE family protein phosphatase [Rhodothermales bacterium]